jgi:hypothetical protein
LDWAVCRVEPARDAARAQYLPGDALHFNPAEIALRKEIANQSAKHHRELRALGFHPPFPPSPAGEALGRGWPPVGEPSAGDRIEQAPAMPDQGDAEILQMFGRQIG